MRGGGGGGSSGNPDAAASVLKGEIFNCSPGIGCL